MSFALPTASGLKDGGFEEQWLNYKKKKKNLLKAISYDKWQHLC